MMNRDMLDRILELHGAAMKPVDVDGKKYIIDGMKQVLPKIATTLKVETLSGLVNYVTDNKDNVKTDFLAIVVENHSKVSLVGNLRHYSHGYDRAEYVRAELSSDIETFPFGLLMDHETFIIKMLTLFEKTKQRDEFIANVNKVSKENVSLSEDTGVTTNRTTKEQSWVKLDENVVNLRPYRTFIEVENPETSFIFRVTSKGGQPFFALFECDGGAWRNTARENIKAYLKKNLPADVPVFA